MNDQRSHKPYESGGRDKSPSPGIFAQGKPRPEPLHRVRHEKCAQCDDRRNADARRLAEREVFDRMR